MSKSIKSSSWPAGPPSRDGVMRDCDGMTAINALSGFAGCHVHSQHRIAELRIKLEISHPPAA